MRPGVAPEATSLGGRAGERGFTLIELLAYLGLMTTFLGAVAGADFLARRLYRRDSALIAGFQAREQVFGALAEAFDRARAIRVGEDGAIAFEGGPSLRLDAASGIIERDGKPLTGGVVELRIAAVAGQAGIYEAILVTRGSLEPGQRPADSGSARTYSRRFFLRNREGDPRGWS